MPDFAAVPAQFITNVDGSVTPDPSPAGSSIPGIVDDNPATLANYNPSGGNWTQTASGISVPASQAGNFFLPYNAFSPAGPFSGGSFWLRFNPATALAAAAPFPAYGVLLHYLNANNWWGIEMHWSSITSTGNLDDGGIWAKATIGGVQATTLLGGVTISAFPDWSPHQDFLLAGSFGPFYNVISVWKYNLSAQPNQTSPNPYTWGKEDGGSRSQPGILIVDTNDAGTSGGGGTSVGGWGAYPSTFEQQHGTSPAFPKTGQGFYLTNPRAGDVIKEMVWRPWIP